MVDFETQVSLREAYEGTGRAIFGDVWRATKAGADEPFDPSPIIERRGKVERRLAEIRNRGKELDLDIIDASDGERDDIVRESKQLFVEGDRLRAELLEIPKPREISETEQAMFDRRMHVEKQLWRAFRAGALTLRADVTSYVDIAALEGRAGFSVSFEFSLIRRPARATRRRHAVASVDRQGLDAWLRLNFEESGNMRSTPEGLCLNWLQAEVRRPKLGTKSDYFHRAQESFPELSRRAFDRAWDVTAPSSWKQSGPTRVQ